MIAGDMPVLVHNCGDEYDFDGSVRYRAPDSQGRNTGISASVSRATLRRGEEARGISVLGFPDGHGTELNLARGHLLANLLGGKRVPRNFVTLTQDPVNSPIMRSIEKRIYNAARKGEVIQYDVTPIYDGDNEIPSALILNAVGNRGFRLNNLRLNNPAGMFHILDDDY